MAKYLTVKEAADFAGVSGQAVHKWTWQKDGLQYEMKRETGKKPYKVIKLSVLKKWLKRK